MMLRPSAAAAAAVMGILNFRLTIRVCMCEQAGCGPRRGDLLFTVKLHKRAGGWTTAFYFRLQPKNRKTSLCKLKHKAPADMHEAGALWAPSFKHYDVIVGSVPFKHSHVYVLHLGGPAWIIRMFPFSPHYNSGLDPAWHWALAWLRHGLNESKYKMQTKAILNVWSSRPWQIWAILCAITDRKILANQV